MDINSSGLTSAAAQLESIAEGLDDAAGSSSRDSRTIKNGVEEAVSDSVANIAVPMAKKRGAEHVGDNVSDIDSASGKWAGKMYRDGITADDVVVLSHEYGSGTHNNGSAYRIESSSGDGPIAIEVAGKQKIVDYVMHPGVPEQGFMRKSLQDSADQTFDAVQDEVVDRLQGAFE